MNVITEIVPTSFFGNFQPWISPLTSNRLFLSVIQKKKQPFDGNPRTRWIAGLLAVKPTRPVRGLGDQRWRFVPGRRAERENVGGFLRSQSVRVYLTKFLHSTHKRSETDRWTDLPKVAELVSSLKLESDICPRHLYCMLVSNDNKDVNNNNNNNNIYWVLTVDPTLFHKRHTLIPLILTKTSWDRGYYYFYFSGRNRSSE